MNLEKEQKDYYKKKLEERAESNSSEIAVVQDDDIEDSMPDLCAIKNEPQIAMPNISNSVTSSAKKRKSSAEPNSRSIFLPLEFKSTARSGDDIESLNRNLYDEYCYAMNRDSALTFKRAVSEVSGNIKTCINNSYDSQFDIRLYGIRAIEFLYTHLLTPPSKLDIEDLELVSHKIQEIFGSSIKCVQFQLVSLEGKVFNSRTMDSSKIFDCEKILAYSIKFHDFDTMHTGHEVWLVQHFEKGPGESLWFQGKSHRSYEDAYNLAILSFINFKIPEIDQSRNKLLNEVDLYFLKKTIWREMRVQLDFEEETLEEFDNTIEIEIFCTLTSLYDDEIFLTEKASYSIRKNASEVSRQYAINAAKKKVENKVETKFFEEVFGVDGPTAFMVDQLGRPVEEN